MNLANILAFFTFKEQAMMLDKVIIVLVCFISMVITAENLKNFRGGHFRVYKGDQENEVCRFILFFFSFLFIYPSRKILYLENPFISNNPISRKSSDISNILNIFKVKTNIVNISDT